MRNWKSIAASTAVHAVLFCCVAAVLRLPAAGEKFYEVEAGLGFGSGAAKITGKKYGPAKKTVAAAVFAPHSQSALTAETQGDLPVSKTQTAPAGNPLAAAGANAAGGQADSGGGAGGGSYYALVLQRIEAAKRYPESARRAGLEGVAKVSFAVDSNGNVLGLHLDDASPYVVLGREALATVLRAAPFASPPRPDERFAVLIEFRLPR